MQDIKLAKDLFALSSSAQSLTPITEQHGVDILLGGHDHFYYISRGVDAWQGCDTAEQILGAEDDNEDVLVIKSGTDFRELSQIVLELEDAPYAIRRKTIKRITGRDSCVKNSAGLIFDRQTIRYSARLKIVLEASARTCVHSGTNVYFAKRTHRQV